MVIVEPVREKDVADYEFTFVGGDKLSFPLELDKGDKIVDTGNSYLITITAKPSLIDETDMSDPAEIEVYKANILARTKTDRKVPLPTEEEIFNRRAFLKSLTTAPKELQ